MTKFIELTNEDEVKFLVDFQSKWQIFDTGDNSVVVTNTPKQISFSNEASYAEVKSRLQELGCFTA